MSIKSIHQKTCLNQSISSNDIYLNKVRKRAFLIKLMTTIEEHALNPSFNASKLANLMSINEPNLLRIRIKYFLGKSPTALIKEYRMKKACERLASHDKVGSIALEVGFTSQSYFNRCFKEQYKCTPTQYRKLFRS